MFRKLFRKPPVICPIHNIALVSDNSAPFCHACRIARLESEVGLMKNRYIMASEQLTQHQKLVKMMRVALIDMTCKATHRSTYEIERAVDGAFSIDAVSDKTKE